ARFYSDSPNEYPLLMLGVAGNGKSIEINRRINEILPGAGEFEFNRICFDLEDACTQLTYGITYECPEDTPLWLFCIKMLDGIMKYIKKYNNLCATILNNFTNIVVRKNLATEEAIKLFQMIGNFHDGDNTTETKIFDTLINFLDKKDAYKNIQILMSMFMWIMYCSSPDQKQYIVIDNIEQYIKLNNLKIQIPNSDISMLYKAVNKVVMNMVGAFERIGPDLAWKAFKIIIVLRRTSLGLLDATLLHYPVKEEQNITDITGHFQVADIWANKKKYLYEKKLKQKFYNEKNVDIIRIVDDIMSDDAKAKGTDYQSIIAPLMSYGIRRNAKAQAHAAYSIYKILTNKSTKNIHFEEYIRIMEVAGGDNSTVHYMFRRALIEFQFKWSISLGKKDRWGNLGIGHLTVPKEHLYNGRKFMIEGISYCKEGYVTLMRRILTYLSYFPEEKDAPNYRYGAVTYMFSTCSLFELVQGIFMDPRKTREISDEDFLQLARVLLALSNMSNGDTKSAPYVILGINDSKFHRNPTESVLAKLLASINEAGYEESLPEGKYSRNDFCVRITDAGNSFLVDWQASFSLMASLHCFTTPPLFFLNDFNSIKYTIETVYDASYELCSIYENEAESFCGKGVSIKRKPYLPKHNDKYITFKQRVKDLHMDHLNLYRTFLERNYNYIKMNEKDMIKLTRPETGIINKYINLYSKWTTTEGAPKCF
ncbi:MAG: hypothetical protein J6C32_07865, partial [Eubacterium sp.]|nr:hypothetical protein [Eubacterium sp.]